MKPRSGDEESVYTLDAGRTSQSGPRVIKYNISQHAGGPKVKMHVDSSQVESILNPVKGVRDAQRRAGIEPVNHSRNNALAVKEQSRLNALKKLQEQEEAEQAEQNRGKPALRRTSSGGSRPTSRPGTGLQRQHSSSGRNFVEENKVTAAATCKPAKAEQRTDDPEAFLQKRDYGRVPEYLLERKMQLAEEYDAVQAAKQAALIPAGMRMLPEEERLETLAILEQNRSEVERHLQALPITIETPSQIRRKDELERRIAEIENAAKIFRRPNVLVHE
eukprot:jgi/Chrzof1/3003/Cz12g07200.t1